MSLRGCLYKPCIIHTDTHDCEGSIGEFSAL